MNEKNNMILCLQLNLEDNKIIYYWN